jgi:hypothetical protein
VLGIVLQNVKRREGNREDIDTIKDGNGWLIADSIEKANVCVMCPLLLSNFVCCVLSECGVLFCVICVFVCGVLL